MNVLLVEDDPGIGRFVSRGLTAEGYAVEWLHTAREAREALGARPYAAAILDLGLPDGDGLDLCAEMRARGVETPVLMLTARETLADKLDGFSRGADDYLTKPFSFEELLARLKVAAGRGQSLLTQIVRAGAMRLDLKARTVELDGAPLDISRREFDVLACLARRMGEPVARGDILDEIWGDEAELSANTVDVYVGYLRRRFSGLPDAPRIETVRGVGFRLSPPQSA